MTPASRPRVWTRPRLFALAASALVLVLFVAANAHLIAVSFASQPGCVPHPQSSTEGAALYRAAKPSC